jgi:hypothetical protein
VFQNRVLRRTFGPKREEAAAGGWRKFRMSNEKLQNINSSPDIIIIIIIMNQERKGRQKSVRFLTEDVKRRDSLADIVRNGRLRLKLILKNGF